MGLVVQIVCAEGSLRAGELERCHTGGETDVAKAQKVVDNYCAELLKARRYFDQSIEAAMNLGARYDLARAQLDSALAFSELEDRRQLGEQLLGELWAVVPEIEREQFPW